MMENEDRSTEELDVPADAVTPAQRMPRIRFDRNELAGSFGDIGTDLPLIVAMIPAAGLDASSVFIVFGLAQILTGVLYGVPMPMQPLKAMAVLVISQGIAGEVLHGAGLAIGAIMLALTVSGLLTWLVRVIPTCVVRGIQLGLGLQLATLALKTYIPSHGATGYILAFVSFAVVVALFGSRRLPAALPVVGFGMLYAVFVDLDLGKAAAGIGFDLPRMHVPSWSNIATGCMILALPQLPLSISNSVIATSTTLHDLFPDKNIGIRKIGLTYSLANLLAPLFGGIPVCHGCGGLAGHYAFGARTGGSVVIYGSAFLATGLFFGGVADQVVRIFPQPVLGVILLFEALSLMLLFREAAAERRTFLIGLLVALCALTLPQGFLIGLGLGTLLHVLPTKYSFGGD